MLEIREILRLWLAGMPNRQIARQPGLDPKTVRRYVREAQGSGLRVELGPLALT